MKLRFKPAAPGSGIAFVRSDQPEPARITARVENLTKRSRRTSLRNGTVAVETVEHCLAAVRGLSIDNLEIELDNAELPAVDGSSTPFVEVLSEAGIAEQDAERRCFKIPQVIRVSDGDAELVAWPGEGERLDIIYELDYGRDSVVGRQIHRFALTQEGFVDELAPARTFITDEEARQLRAAGLGKHLTYQDILVIGPQGPIENQYRFPDECVRHKILDLVGDLVLLGSFVSGRIYARKSGHNLNHELVRRLHELRLSTQLHERLKAGAKLDIHAVQRVLPHRYPMLLVDRVVEIEGDRRAVGIKNVTINEPFFQGHYPGQPIMPGVMILEALAQLSGILLSRRLEHTGKVAVLLSMDRVKMRRPVRPGDQLILQAERLHVRSRTGHCMCKAFVGQDVAAQAEIKFMLVDAEPI